MLPLFGTGVLLFVLSALNRNYISSRVEALVTEQLGGTAEILRVNIAERLEEGAEIREILDIYKSEESIYYMALLDRDRNVLDWVSRFDGYLPLSRDRDPGEASWIISSPAGKIFNTFSSIETGGGAFFYLYLFIAYYSFPVA